MSEVSHPLALVVDPSPGVRESTQQPVEAAGFACTVVPSLEAALRVLGRAPVALTLINADRLSLDQPRELTTLREQGARTGPVLFLASPRTSAEILELGAQVGVDDCILGPLRLWHLQARVRALQGLHEATVRPRYVLAIGGASSRASSLGQGLRARGLLLLPVPSVEAATAALSSITTAPVSVLLSLPGDARAHLSRLQAGKLARTTVVVQSAQPAPRPLPPAVRQWDAPTEDVPGLVEALAGTSGALRLAAVSAGHAPFHCLVEFRAVDTAGARWVSGFSGWLSPQGLWVNTLVPPRQGSPVELRLHLTTTGELVEGTGLVSLSNPFLPGSGVAGPTGAEIDFLGMSPARLGRLRQICTFAAAAAETANQRRTP